MIRIGLGIMHMSEIGKLPRCGKVPHAPAPSGIKIAILGFVTIVKL